MRPDWPTSRESGSRYNGPLSTWREWHATILGATVGVAAAVAGVPWLLVAFVALVIAGARWSTALREAVREPWYATGAAVLAFGATGAML